MGSAIYAPSEPGVIQAFGVTETVASLGLALYVFAYGLGPMLWAPLSEIPSIGRNPPYIGTFAIFVILAVPTALVDNIGGLLFLRFLQGFFGSPCLATGGASLGDMFSLIKLPYSLCLWALFATGGPALGPIISGFSVPKENWHWSLWEILWMSAPAFILLFSSLPETSAQNILLRRAVRLRKLTGNTHLKSQSEIDQAEMSAKDTAIFYLWKPWQITVLDPAVLFTSVYTSLVYGIFYSFFEVFPLVYPVMYGFTPGESGLAFLPIPLFGALSVGMYWAYLWYIVEPDLRKNGLPAPEKRLIPALLSSFLVPIGLFWFGKFSPHLSNPLPHFTFYPPSFQTPTPTNLLKQRLDVPPLDPLHHDHVRHRRLHHRRLHHPAMHLPLRAPHLPPLRRLPLRRKRLLPLLHRLRRHSLLHPDV